LTANEVLQISQLTASDADELLRFIRSIQADDPLRPITVVAPSNYASLSLRHRLGLSGIANVHFIVIPRLAELISAHSLSEQGRRPLTSVINSEFVRGVASQAKGMLEPLRDHPSTHMSLRRTFRQLRYATEYALNSLAVQGGLRAETIALYRAYRKRMERYYDNEDLAQAAATAVRSGNARGLDDLGFIVFFRVRGLTSSQRNLAQALAESGRCAMLLGLTGDTASDRSTIALANEMGNKANHPYPVHLVSQRVHLLVAPDAHQELRWVIRRIMRHAESGTPFHRMAVLYRKEAPYGTLIREELALAGVPAAGLNTASLADTAVGSTLTGLLDLREADFARDAVMAWLTGNPIKPPPGIDAASFNPTLWDTISKRAKVVRGAEAWEQRLNQFAENQDRDAQDWEQRGEIYEARAFRMRADAAVARQLARFITDLIEAADSDGNATWEDYSCWTNKLLERYLADRLSFPESERHTYDKIKRILDELQSLDDIEGVSPPPSFDVFRRALNDALQVSAGHRGFVGHGVFVAPLNLAAAMSFDVVHIVGMIEGAVPPAFRDDPLIPERDRERAGGSAAGLPPLQQKDYERYDYLAALATAPEYTLSYPVADPAGQRENFPSRWFLEAASRLEGTSVLSSDLGKLGDEDRNWLTRIASMERSLDTTWSVAPADAHDYNMERLQTWKSAGLNTNTHQLTQDNLLTASIRLSIARQDREFTEWDGNLGAVGVNFADMLTERALSPTSLERWAKCPFSYFLGTVLRLSAAENPEDIYDITPLERGSLVHNILEEFIAAAIQQSSLPSAHGEWNSRHRTELRRIAGRHFADAEARGVIGKAVLWQIARDEILIDLEAFLDEDLRMRRKYGVSPVFAEAEFGIGEDGWRPADLTLPDGSQISFRGKIDRVDANESRERVMVLDYKTGGSSSYRMLKDDPIDRGQRLQLAIYSLAARQALGPKAHGKCPDVSAAYWFVTSGGKFELMPLPLVNIEDEGVMKRFREGISTIVSGIRSGLFPANPGSGDPGGAYNYESNCRFCDFKTLCPSRRDVQWKRKSRAPELADYVQLSEGDEH
jgi:RecB family exonuclease